MVEVRQVADELDITPPENAFDLQRYLADNFSKVERRVRETETGVVDVDAREVGALTARITTLETRVTNLAARVAALDMMTEPNDPEDTDPESIEMQLYADSADHSFVHDNFRNVTLSQAPTNGKTLYFTLRSANQYVTAVASVPSRVFLELNLYDTTAQNHAAGGPSPGNNVIIQVMSVVADNGQPSFVIGTIEWSLLNFMMIRRVSDTKVGILFTNDGIDFSGRLEIHER